MDVPVKSAIWQSIFQQMRTYAIVGVVVTSRPTPEPLQ